MKKFISYLKKEENKKRMHRTISVTHLVYYGLGALEYHPPVLMATIFFLSVSVMVLWHEAE